MIEIGQKVIFDPFSETYGFASDLNRGQILSGVVVYINERNKWFSVEYGKHKLRTSFKFSQIGKEVKLDGK